MIPNYSSIRMLSKKETDKVLDAIPASSDKKWLIRLIGFTVVAMVGIGIVMWVGVL